MEKASEWTGVAVGSKKEEWGKVVGGKDGEGRSGDSDWRGLDESGRASLSGRVEGKISRKRRSMGTLRMKGGGGGGIGIDLYEEGVAHQAVLESWGAGWLLRRLRFCLRLSLDRGRWERGGVGGKGFPPSDPDNKRKNQAPDS
jgi:hypothetical protein